MALIMVFLYILKGPEALCVLTTYFLQFKILKWLMPKLIKNLQSNDLLASFPLHTSPNFVYLHLVWSLERQRANSV